MRCALTGGRDRRVGGNKSVQRMELTLAGQYVITFGTFDVFHVGHVRVLNRSAALGDRLVVGPFPRTNSTFAKKGRNRSSARKERLESVANVKAVDAVFIEGESRGRSEAMCWNTRPTSW